MSYEDTLRELGGETAARVLALYELVERGDLTLPEFRELAAVILAAANARGVTLAELSLYAFLAQAIGTPAPAVGVPPTPHQIDADRLTRALVTITESELDTRMQLDRLARSEPVEASQRAYGEAMDRSPRVSGWVRNLESGACQLCQWWSRDGRVWPTDHRMPTHKGCHCTPTPVAN